MAGGLEYTHKAKHFSVHTIRAENKDFRLIRHLLCASRFPSMVYCLFMPGQITNLTGQKAIKFGICPVILSSAPSISNTFFKAPKGMSDFETV